MDLTQLRGKLGDRYDIDRELGRGGMGAVYLAQDKRLGRPVALKVLPDEMAGTAGVRDRFLRETRTAASFSHPNIVPVYSIEEGDGLLAYAMAYVEGESLADRVKRAGPLTIRETVKLLQDAGYALAYAHGRGVVHRDIKPDNIMLERATGRAMVMDFGISRGIAAAPAGATQALTRIGEVVGTPEYMSPEQATGDNVDGRSDLYSLGLTAYFALTGRPAITGDTTGRILARQITEQVPPIQSVRSDTPQALAAAIDRCVMKEAADRFQTGEELVETIDAAKLSGPEIPLSIRILQQELSSFSLVLVFIGIVIYFLVLLSEYEGDTPLFVVLLISVLFTRTMQTMREVGRIARSGFTASDIASGLRTVMAERDQRRQELRADAETRAARRRTLIAAVAMLAAAMAMFAIVMHYRVQVGPKSHRVNPPGNYLILPSFIMFGVSVALLLRSPFRQPIGERLFRIVWLGPLGRFFVWNSGRKVWKRMAAGGTVTRSGVAVVQPRTTTPPVAAPVVAPDRIAALEQRVSDLERWRKEAR